jgi:hypothetical protein
MATYIKSCESCDANDPCGGGGCIPIADGGSIEITEANKTDCFTYVATYGECQQSLGITITNSTDSSITIKVDGGVDDDVAFDGVVYEDGAYCFFRGDCVYYTVCVNVNGAHSFSYQQVLPIGSSLNIKGIDNGLGGGISCEITILAA